MPLDPDDLFAFNAPALRSRRDREIQGVERPALTFAKKCGWRNVKLGQNSMPDRMFFRGPPAEAIFVEFKAKGKEARENQARRLAEFEAMGFKAYLIDRKEQFDDVFRR